MKRLRIFKSRTGAISGVKAGMLALMVASVGFSVASYFGGGPVTDDNAEVRNLTTILASGQKIPPQYASLTKSFTKGDLQFATAEEQNQFKQTLLGDLEGDEQNVENLDFSGLTFSGGEAGLGMGNDINFITAPNSNGAGGTAVNTDGVKQIIKEKNKKEKEDNSGESRVKALSNATITRASGSNYNATPYGGSTNNSDGGTSTSTTTTTNSSTRSFDGTMPRGSTHVRPTVNLQGAHSTGYKLSPADRAKLRKKNRQNINESGNEVKQIALESRELADTEGPANKGSIPFMRARGVDYVVDAPRGGASGNKVGGVRSSNLHRSNPVPEEEDLDDKIDPRAEYDADRDAAENHLKAMMMALLFSALIILPIVSHFAQIKPWGLVAAAVLASAVIFGMCLPLLIKAWAYKNAYSDFDHSTFGGVLAVGFGVAAVVGIALIGPVAKALDKLFLSISKNWFGASFLMGSTGAGFMPPSSDADSSVGDKIAPVRFYKELHAAKESGVFEQHVNPREVDTSAPADTGADAPAGEDTSGK